MREKITAPIHSSGDVARQASVSATWTLQHVGEIHRQRQHHDEHLDDHAVDERAHGVHVAGRAVDERAALVGVEEAEAQPLQLVVNAAAQLDEHALRKRRAGHRRGESQRRSAEGDNEHGAGDRRHDEHRRPACGWCDSQRPMWRGARRTESCPQVVDRQANQPQAADVEQHQRTVEQHDP